MDVGFDKALIGAYGQDDRICAFTSLQALLGCKEPKKTAVCFFVDKEEVASTGDTSAQSFALRNFARRYCSLFKAPYDADNLLEQAEALSADVTTAFDPNFPDKFDATNHACLGKGIVIEKAGAAGSGKFRANEARAEYMQVIRTILAENNISWQTGALAKLGIGGGGTIAPFLSRYGLDCVDAGPCLLSMHSPFELSSKFDLISTYQLYQQFFLS
jgi:aspartyl aminopeptidase